MTLVGERTGILLEGTNWFKCASSFLEKTCAKYSQEARLALQLNPLFFCGQITAEELHQSARSPCPRHGAQSTVSQISFTLWLKSSG